MSKIKIVLGFIVAIICALNTALYAAETESLASIGVYSSYVFRGQVLSKGIAIQPQTGVNYNGLGVSLWSNIDTSESTEMNETDVTLNYTHFFTDDITVFEIGYIYYSLDSAHDTQEAYFTISYDTAISMSFSGYYDFAQGGGGFFELGIEYGYYMPNTMEIKTGVTIAYNLKNKLNGVGIDGELFSDFYNLDISLSLNIPVAKAFNLALSEDLSIEPMIAYSLPITDNAEHALQSVSTKGYGSVFYSGITVGLTF